ncbi:MAG: hypothetical protein JWM53_439 [bacterium]|nr:hypothetical protein [bacterium]
MVRMPPKTTCPISRADFLAKAEPLKLDLGNGQTLTAEPREFSTGSFGWYVNQKATITVDGKSLTVQVGSNLIVVGSKEAAKAGGAAESGGGESAGG